jgi:hypothetical protein
VVKTTGAGQLYDGPGTGHIQFNSMYFSEIVRLG